MFNEKRNLMKKTFLLSVLCCFVLSAHIKAQTLAFDTLDINNVRAVFNSAGFNFQSNHSCFFEVPKGSHNKTIASNLLWMAGKDVHDQIHVAGGIGTSTGRDYYPGPLTVDGTASTDSSTMADWNKVWKVSKQQILYHQTHYALPGYVAPVGIATWPAHGNPASNQAQFLAPFYDRNGDQIYNPSDGDYPLIQGDEAVYFIFNDKGGIHDATGGIPIGIEVHAMAYAFQCGDSALNNTIFISYKIYNRSTYWLGNTMIGVYNDLRSGNEHNDLTRCDIKRNSFYTYSGTNTDPIFGNLFAAQAVTILGGPYMDPDGLDNPKYDTLLPATNCNEAINGQNFGNGTIDDERYGMTGFMSFKDTGNLAALTAPANSGDYVHYLNSFWRDNSPLTYWGEGHPAAGGYGPTSKFMFPNNSDPCNLGTDWIAPGSPYPSAYWTEEQATNIPSNRQGLACMGHFTFEPGGVEFLDVAFVFGMDYAQPNNVYGWQNVLNQRIDSVRKYYANDSTPCGESISGIVRTQDKPVTYSLSLYPNPANDVIHVDIKGFDSGDNWCVFDLLGRTIKQGKLYNDNLFSISIDDLPQGLYFYQINHEQKKLTNKFVKL